MLRSMTAYGRATVKNRLGRLSVELQSVNRKHLEINTYLPPELIRYDVDLKKWVSEFVGRGQVNVRVFIMFDETCPVTIIPNMALAKQLVEAWKKLGSGLSLTVDDKMLTSALARNDDILTYDIDISDEGKYRDILRETTSEALHKLMAMKTTEGEALYNDITARVDILARLIEEIAIKAPGATERYRKKLSERIQEVLGTEIDHEEKLAREVCVFAEKIDIAEEITRFHSHLQQFRSLLKSDEQAVGKTLEFLVQELNREANTIGSKSSDIEVTQRVIGIKTELERIREQIQNVE